MQLWPFAMFDVQFETTGCFVSGDSNNKSLVKKKRSRKEFGRQGGYHLKLLYSLFCSVEWWNPSGVRVCEREANKENLWGCRAKWSRLVFDTAAAQKRISDKCGLNWSWQTICVRVKLNLSSPLINNLEWEMGKLKSCISLVSFIVKLAASATPTSCSDTCLYVWNKQTLHVHQCGFDELWPVWVFADRSAPTRIHTKAIKWY